jgi:hypothetical protein
LLALLAFGVRAAAVVALKSYREPFTYEHGEIAENLLAGRGFAVKFLGEQGPTSQQAPLYPAMLAVAYWVFGVKSQAAFLAIQLLQCAAGTVTVLCTTWLVWSVFRSQGSGVRSQESAVTGGDIRPLLAPDSCLLTPGWLAGLLIALHPAQVYMVTHIQVAPWATLLLTLLVATALSPCWRGRWAGAAMVGLLGGVALLTEPIFILALPFLAIAFVVHPSTPLFASWRLRAFALRSVGQAALMAAVCLGVIALWLWRNNAVHGEFVFIKSTFGYAFWQGNNPLSWGTDKIPKLTAAHVLATHDGSAAGLHRAACEARHETSYIDDVVLKPGGYREFHGLTEPQRCRLLGERGMAFVREEPREYVRLCLNRLRYFFLWDETNPKAGSWVYRSTTLAWLAFCLLGMWTTRDRWRSLWPLYGVCGAIALFHVLTIVSARFRLPLEPLSSVWAAAGLFAVFGRRR